MKIRIKKTTFFLHPLMIVCGMGYVFIGKVQVLLASLCAMLIHELGHFLAGKALGIPISFVELTPFGGVITVDGLQTVSPLRRVVFAFAGPAASALGCFLAAFAANASWIDLSFATHFVRSNFLLLCVNLLPVLPLDGGRIVRAFLENWIGFQKATQTLVWIGCGTGIGLGLLSLLMALKGILNPAPAFAGIYLCYAAAQEAKQGTGHYINSLIARRQRLENHQTLPMEFLAVSENTPLPVLLRHLSPGKYHMIYQVDEDGMACKRIIDEKTLCDSLFQVKEQNVV